MVGQTAATWIKNLIIPYLRNKQSSWEDLCIPCAAGWAAQGDKATFLKLQEGTSAPSPGSVFPKSAQAIKKNPKAEQTQ